MPRLLISVRFHEGRYHGSGEWPPSPARLFQALVAGAARGENLPGPPAEAFNGSKASRHLKSRLLRPMTGRAFKNFVPNNDLDAVGGDPARISEIRAAKIIRPRFFDAAVPLLYAWTFEPGADAARHAKMICEIASTLYQLGRGVDMAWAQSEVLAEREAVARLRDHGAILWRPNQGGSGEVLSCPHSGSLASLTARFKKMRERFTTVAKGKKSSQLFSQAPKPSFRQIPYDSPSVFLLFDVKKAGSFAAEPIETIVAFTEKIRNQAAERLKQGLPDRATLIDRVFIGRDATEADKARRIRITPLPSIGHAQTERSVRRVLVTVPPDCPIAADDVAWAFSGLALDFDLANRRGAGRWRGVRPGRGANDA